MVYRKIRQLKGLKAFTLAEVLITLAIIGIVAALTIPAVVLNYQKQEVIARLKKTYSALANTTNLAIAEEGPITSWVLEFNKSKEFAEKYLIPFLKVSKNCEYNTNGDCKFAIKYINNTQAQNQLGSDWARFYLHDGTLVSVLATNLGRAELFIDINGQRKPNILGKDIFFLTYRVTMAYNLGKFIGSCGSCDRETLLTEDASWACTKTGHDCMTLIMLDGWQIKDDYPW